MKEKCIIKPIEKVGCCQSMLDWSKPILPFSVDIRLVKRKNNIYDLVTLKGENLCIGFLDLEDATISYRDDIDIMLKIQIMEEINRNYL